jgi:hypothetical protein
MQVRSIIDDVIDDIIQLIQQHGWLLVFIALGLYIFRNQISKTLKSISLAQANNPTRRALFDSEARRVRSNQQLDLKQSSLEKKR